MLQVIIKHIICLRKNTYKFYVSNNSLPIIDLSNKKKQKSVFGITGNKEEYIYIY